MSEKVSGDFMAKKFRGVDSMKYTTRQTRKINTYRMYRTEKTNYSETFFFFLSGWKCLVDAAVNVLGTWGMMGLKGEGNGLPLQSKQDVFHM